MPSAEILSRPARFARVDRVKEYTGQPIEPEDDLFWILGDPLVVQVDGSELIEVPVGYTTDGASIPKWATGLPGWGRWEDPQRWAGVTHDWLYTQTGVTKKRADQVFRAVLVAEDAGFFKRAIMYAAVVVGGGPAYRKSQESGPRVFV